MKKMIMLSLLALTSVATQAQTQKDEGIRAWGPSYMMSSSEITLDKNTKESTVIWQSTENNSWHEDIGILDNVPVNDSESAHPHLLPNHLLPKGPEMKGYTSISWELVDEGDNTVLHCYFRMPADIVKNLWLGNAESCILDKETGVIYQAISTVPERCYNKVFGVRGKEGTVLDLQILFPRLPKTVKKMVIYGVPNWSMRGFEVKSEISSLGHVMNAYDTIPQFHMARIMKESVDYNKDNLDSWAVYTDAHLIKPVKENTMALWRTPDATYLAIATEQNWIREYYGRGGNAFLLGQEGRKYKCKGVMGYPNDNIFWLEGYPGDHFAIVLVFEPLSLNVKTFNYVVPEGEPFSAWGASWSGKVISNLDVQQLRNNQHLFEYHPRVVVK